MVSATLWCMARDRAPENDTPRPPCGRPHALATSRAQDGFGGGWTKSQILRIMRDSRNGSYATMGGSLWILAKSAAIAQLGQLAMNGSVWAAGVR